MFKASRCFLLLALSLSAALLALQPVCVYACSCRAPGTPAEELQQSDAVFLGTVVSALTPNAAATGSGGVVTVTFAVSQVWKGQIAQTQTLSTPDSSASCGIAFQQGQQYLIYGRASDGGLSAILCSRTRPASDATEDLAALGAGQLPVVNANAPTQLPATSVDNTAAARVSRIFLLGVFSALAVVMGLLLIVRSGRKTNR